jgi:hypothetical protein
MLTKNSAADKSSGTELLSGPVHNYLGRDADGDHHHWNRRTDTVTVISHTGSRTYQYTETDVSRWVRYVADRRGWDDLRFVDGRDIEFGGALL